MRQLHLVRHAKSSWDEATLADFDRPLNTRGRRDAPRMAERLARRQIEAPYLLTSPALRALQTARFFAAALGVGEDRIASRPEIYAASPGTLMALINHLSCDAAHVVLVGHNPGISALARLLAPCPFIEMPTCAIVSLGFDHDWQQIKSGDGRLLSYLTPRAGP